jgi:hypothetical protein
MILDLEEMNFRERLPLAKITKRIFSRSLHYLKVFAACANFHFDCIDPERTHRGGAEGTE